MNTSPTATPPDSDTLGAYLDMPADRRAAAKAHVALISATVRKCALALPLNADVDDFRRVLTTEAKP